MDNENIVADGLPVSVFPPPLEVLWPSLLFFLIMFLDESLQLRHLLEVTTYIDRFRRIDDCIVFNTGSV